MFQVNVKVGEYVEKCARQVRYPLFFFFVTFKPRVE